MAAVQIAPVAERAGIAAGTVYRYFPSKTELVAALVAALAQAEIAALSQGRRRRARAAVGAGRGDRDLRRARARRPAARLRADRRAGRPRRRRRPGDVSQGAGRRVRDSASAPRCAAGHLPDQDAAAAAPALVGALLEGLIGPLAPAAPTIRPSSAPRCRRSRCSRCARSAWSMRARAASWCRRAMPASRSMDALHAIDYCSVAPAIQSVTARSAPVAARRPCSALRTPQAARRPMCRRRDRLAAPHLGRAAERLGIVGGLLDHPIEHLGDGDGAVLGRRRCRARRSAARATCSRPRWRATTAFDVGIEPGIAVRDAAPACGRARRSRAYPRPACSSRARATPASDA